MNLTPFINTLNIANGLCNMLVQVRSHSHNCKKTQVSSLCSGNVGASTRNAGISTYYPNQL